MPVYRKSLELPYKAGDLFDLVADIEHYPDFIRWIRSMHVSHVREQGEVRECRGEAQVGFRGFSETFATDVIADRGTATIKTDLVKGPFRRLKNSWAFVPLGGGRTRIDFEIDYVFSNPILAFLARRNLDLAVGRIMGAFTEEAARRYGPK